MAGLAGCQAQDEVLTEPDDQAELRVMTFNIRWASPNDGANVWENRSEWVASIIDTSSAHIVGLQEVVHRQLEDIMAEQTRFEWVGVGRDDGQQGGEYSPILYDSDRFELVDSDTKWLSETPDVVGSVGWDAALPRVTTRITLVDVLSGDTVRVINTHFDHRGEQARIESAAMIGSWGGSYDVALGDFNFQPDTEAYEAMIAGGWVDAGAGTHDGLAETGTFRTFDPASETSVRIDYVFHSEDWSASSYDILAPIRDGAYPSDHLPVVVDLR